MRRGIVRWLGVAATILCCWAQTAAALPGTGESIVTGTLSALVRTPGSDMVRLEVITGCGFCLRVLKCVATPSTIAGKGGIVRPIDLRPGSVLRVRYRQEKEGNVALAVELVLTEDEQ